MSGYEVAERLREGPETGNARLIALTGWGQEDDRRRSRSAGIDVHLVKPVDLDAILDLLDEGWGGRSLMRIDLAQVENQGFAARLHHPSPRPTWPRRRTARRPRPLRACPSPRCHAARLPPGRPSAAGDGACCSTPASPAPGLAVVDTGCCSVEPAAVVDEALHARLADLLRRYDVNDYAASVKVFAVKPR